MATRRSEASQPSPQPVLVVDLASAEEQLQERVAKGRAIIESPPTSADALRASRQSYYSWDEFNTALLKKLFSTTEIADTYSNRFGFAGGDLPLRQEVEHHVRDVESCLRQLTSIIDRLPLYVPSPTQPAATRPGRPSASTSRSVFVVHGRDGEAKNAVARCLTQLEMTPIILHEHPSQGQTIIEKVERLADVPFAVILLTPEDVGHLQPAPDLASLEPRARQNVIFEWGYFVGRLGRDRVCALLAGGMELPSDMHGVVWVALDDHGAWKMQLVKELKAAGITVDANKVF